MKSNVGSVAVTAEPSVRYEATGSTVSLPTWVYLTLHRNQSRASLKGNGVVSGLVDNWKTPQSGHDCRGGSRAKRPELSAETTVAAGNMLIALGGALGVLPGYL